MYQIYDQIYMLLYHNFYYLNGEYNDIFYFLYTNHIDLTNDLLHDKNRVYMILYIHVMLFVLDKLYIYNNLIYNLCI